MPTKRTTKKAAKKAATKSAAQPPATAAPVEVSAAAATPTFGTPAILIPSERRERAAAKMGPQLAAALASLESAGQPRGLARMSLDQAAAGAGGLEMLVAAAGAGLAPVEPVLPVTAGIPRVEMEPNETWSHYRERVANLIGPVVDRLKASAGLSCLPVFSGNSMQTRALRGQLEEVLQDDGVSHLEMDPPVQAVAMDDAVQDVELPLARFRHPTLDGSGVVVAVLDSGMDIQHPWLKVHASFSIHGQDIAIPGAHATHVAGILASRDSVYPGIAPGVTLLNIRVLDANGRGRRDDVGRGIDKALDEGAHIINLSVAFNHRPTWSQGGHGHSCKEGDCVVCRAVNNALTMSDGALAVVVAAGNEREFCEFLRSQGNGDAFDTELGCPGQARHALTVGAITKQTFVTAPFSSRGPTSYSKDVQKPDIAAPGVNITSAAVMPRDAAGLVLPNLTRADISRKDSGTSMATPIVSGVASLLAQSLLASGQNVEQMRTALRQQITMSSFKPLAAPATEVGVGRINLARL